jgi:phage gpG-like protein
MEVAMGVTGDFGKLAELIKKVGAAATPEWRLRLSKNLAQEARTQMVNGFIAQRDPYGTPWKPTLRGGQILRDKAILMNSVKPSATATSFELSTNVVYAGVHQRGATIKAKAGRYLKFKVGGKWAQKRQVVIPQRRFMPEAGDAGPIWMTAFRRVADEQIRKTIHGG